MTEQTTQLERTRADKAREKWLQTQGGADGAAMAAEAINRAQFTTSFTMLRGLLEQAREMRPGFDRLSFEEQVNTALYLANAAGQARLTGEKQMTAAALEDTIQNLLVLVPQEARARHILGVQLFKNEHMENVFQQLETLTAARAAAVNSDLVLRGAETLAKLADYQAAAKEASARAMIDTVGIENQVQANKGLMAGKVAAGNMGAVLDVLTGTFIDKERGVVPRFMDSVSNGVKKVAENLSAPVIVGASSGLAIGILGSLAVMDATGISARVLESATATQDLTMVGVAALGLAFMTAGGAIGRVIEGKFTPKGPQQQQS